MTTKFKAQSYSKIISQIQERVLNKLFGSEYVNVKTLLQTTSQITTSDSQGYEFELRFIDENGHTSKKAWIDFENRFGKDLKLHTYEDDVIYGYETHIPLNNIHFRSYQKSNMYERKILINSISSRTENKDVLPLIVKLSKETTMSPAKHLDKYFNIQRRQRCSYSFDDPKLSNWKVDKTIRFFTDNIQDRKITFELSIDNFHKLKYYDYLDIEFEYIGEFHELFNSFFCLIEKIYTPYEDFNLIYNVISQTIDFNQQNLFSLIPTPEILTNSMIHTLNPSDFVFTHKIIGEHVIVAIFGDIEHVENSELLDSSLNSSLISIYSLSDSSINHIYGDSTDITNQSNQLNSHQTSISDRLKSYTKSNYSDRMSSLTLFEAEYSNDIYVLIDTIYYCSKNIEKMVLSDRQQYIESFLSINNSFIKTHFAHADYINSTSWNELIDKALNVSTIQLNSFTQQLRTNGMICKPKISSLFTSKMYKIKDESNITIDFKLYYIPLKKLFYLYTIGDSEQIIKSKSVMNKFSIEHTGYSLVSTPNVKNIEILYASPYMRDSFIFKPRLNWVCNSIDKNTTEIIDELMKDMYINPLKYSNQVVKMVKGDDGWIPLSISNHSADSYRESLKNESLIYDELHTSNLNDNLRKISVQPNIKRLMKTIYDLLNQYIIEKYFNKESFNNILDIFDNDNIDINLLYNIGSVKRVYALNERKSNLCLYVENAIDKTFSGQLLTEGIKVKTDNNLSFDLNLIHSPLMKDKMIYELNKQFGYSPKSIDVIYFQCGLDKIKSFIDLISIRLFCENVLAPNGKIIFKLFNGDKLIEFLNSSAQESKQNTMTKTSFGRGRRKIDKSFGIRMCEFDDELSKSGENLNKNVNSNKDSYILPNWESIYSVNSNESNDESQYANLEIDFVEQVETKTPKIEFTNNEVMIEYGNDKFTVEKPKIQINEINLSLICYYYYKFNRYDENGKFKSEKQLTKTQTRNLRSILGINTELFGNIYDTVLDNWYSVYHNVDKLVGSKEYSQNILFESIEDGVLIEKEHLDEYTIDFIRNRFDCLYSTVIITKTKLNELNRFKLNNKYYLYVIYPNFITDEDIQLLNNYLRRNIENPNEELFKYYTHPNLMEDVYEKRLIFKSEFFTFIFESFKMYDICNPITQSEVAGFISSNRSFQQIETVEGYLNTLATLCVERT